MKGETDVRAKAFSAKDKFALMKGVRSTDKLSSTGILRIIAVAIVLALLLFGLIWFVAVRHIPAHRARLYSDPIAAVHNIRLVPGTISPLVTNEILITNAAAIAEIMGALRSAKTYSPNHPSTRWSCILVISDMTGKSHLDILESRGQGTIIYSTTSPRGGLIFDTMQSHTMGQVLERTVATTGARQ